MFQDVGASQTWRVSLPDSSTMPISWSSEGCYLLLRGTGTDRWFISSMLDHELKDVSPEPALGKLSYRPIWSIDSNFLTLAVVSKNEGTDIYSMDISSLETSLMFSSSDKIAPVRWLSETDLLYTTDGKSLFVWDSLAQDTRYYGLRNEWPPDWVGDSELHMFQEAPNGRSLAKYYSLAALRSFEAYIRELPPPEDMTPEYVAAVRAIPRTTGFDIYDFGTASTWHIDVEGQFIQFLKWSPSSRQIVVTTDPITSSNDANGIYIYGLLEKSIHRIENYPAMYNSEYGGYEPTWSSDSQWLAFNTPDGYVAYDLVSRDAIALSPLFDGFYMSLEWSPVMRVSC